MENLHQQPTNFALILFVWPILLSTSSSFRISSNWGDKHGTSFMKSSVLLATDFWTYRYLPWIFGSQTFRHTIITQKKYAELTRSLMLTNQYVGTVRRACEATHVEKNSIYELYAELHVDMTVLYRIYSKKYFSKIVWTRGRHGGPCLHLVCL